VLPRSGGKCIWRVLRWGRFWIGVGGDAILVGVVCEPMHGVRSWARFDFGVSQALHHTIPPQSAPVAKSDDITLVCVPFDVAVRRQRDVVRESVEKFGVTARPTTPFGEETVEFGHLGHTDSRLDVR